MPVGPNKSGSLVAGAAIGFKNHWHQLAALRWITAPLLVYAAHGGNTILVSSGRPARLVSAVFAGNAPINKDRLAVNRVSGRDVKASLLQHASARIQTISCHHALLGARNVPSDHGVVWCVPVAKSIVPCVA